MEGDYADVLCRLTKEERITKYIVKFLEDETFEALCEARKAEDHETVFRAIHTLKGVSQNLGFTKLYQASDAMTEAVRGGVKLQNEELFEKVKMAYSETIDVIKKFESSL